MPADISLTGARAGVSLPLTTIAQGWRQPDFVMKALYPLVEVPTFSGTVIQFDDSIYEDVTDDRADDAPYPEIQTGYTGTTYKLNTKGLSFRVPDKRRKEMENLRINWGKMATDTLMARAGLRHEIECALRATTFANYATTNRVALTAGNRFGDAGTNPDIIIRNAKDAVADLIGAEPNVCVMGRRVFSAMASRYGAIFASSSGTTGPRHQLTLEGFATLYGFRKVYICDANIKTASGRVKAFGNHMVMAYVNPKGIDATISYSANADVNQFEPAFGYTYVMVNNPLMYTPYYDNERGATVYKLDFDRQIANTGVNGSGLITHGYFIQDAV